MGSLVLFSFFVIGDGFMYSVFLFVSCLFQCDWYFVVYQIRASFNFATDVAFMALYFFSVLWAYSV